MQTERMGRDEEAYGGAHSSVDAILYFFFEARTK